MIINQVLAIIQSLSILREAIPGYQIIHKGGWGKGGPFHL